jgi:hypothetical protein
MISHRKISYSSLHGPFLPCVHSGLKPLVYPSLDILSGLLEGCFGQPNQCYLVLSPALKTEGTPQNHILSILVREPGRVEAFPMTQ